MQYRKIILAGGSGYLGKVLAGHFKKRTTEIIILTRTAQSSYENIRFVTWDGKTAGNWSETLENADLLVNLCGKSVNCRYTPANKAAILYSRTIPTKLLGETIAGLKDPPKTWINITAAGIYRTTDGAPQDERSETGDGFFVDVCKQWEDVFFSSPTPHTRKIALRMGVVFGRNDGAFPRLRNLVKFGLGGKQGSGNQFVSWIHEKDVAAITEWLLNASELTGPINCTAPEPVRNKVLMKQIRDIYGMPLGIPAPSWLLELGAMIIGTETELILQSQRVIPKRLLDAGFPFQFPTPAAAIKEISGR